MPSSSLVVAMAVAVLARAASAQPSPTPQAKEPRQCSTTGYLEPSILLAIGSYSRVSASTERPSNGGAVTNRIGGGIELRYCDADGAPTTRVHFGGTVYLSGLDWVGHDNVKAGIGVELEVARPVAARVWLGGRVGVETAAGSRGLFALGGRAHLDHRFWLGVDVFHQQPTSGTSTTGVMAGLGIEGKAGAITAAVEGGILVTGFVLLVLAFASGGGSN